MILVASATTVFSPTVRQTFDDLKNLADTMQRAQTLAADRNHDFLTLEHIVLAMIDDPDGKELMQACGVDLSCGNADAVYRRRDERTGQRQW